MQKLHGTFRGDRRKDELEAPTGRPEPPEWMRDEARTHWEQLVALLEELQILARVDGVAIALLAEALADYVGARNVVEAAASEEGGVKYVCQTDKGNLIQHPAVAVMNRAWDRVLKLCKEFGMTPAARVGLKPAGGSPKDPILELIARHYGQN